MTFIIALASFMHKTAQHWTKILNIKIAEIYQKFNYAGIVVK
jgi:hypothetical protein